MSNGYIFSTIGDVLGRTGDAVYGVSQARYKLYENQVNEVIRLTQDNMDVQIESYVANASEAEIPDLYNNMSKQVWEKYSSIDEIKRNTNNRFSDEVYQEAARRLESQYRPKYESKMKTYEDVSNKVALVSQFTEGFSEVSTYGDWMNIDDARSSARSYLSSYESYTSEFNGFDVVNDNGIFSKTGESGKELMMQSSFSRSLDDFTKQMALKGNNETSEEFISDYESWWNEFSSEAGFDSSKSKVLLDTSKADIRKKFEDYKQQLVNDAQQKVEKAQQMIYGDTDKNVTSEEMLQIYKACGLGDWETNWYSQQALADVSSVVYNVNMEYFNNEVTDYFDSFINDGMTIYVPSLGKSITYEEFIKSGVAHQFDGEGTKTDVNSADYSSFETSGTKSADSKALNEINKNLTTLFSPKKETYQYNFEEVSKTMAKNLGYDEDGYASIMFDKMLTQRFIYETEDDNGLINTQVNNLTAYITSDKYSTSEKQLQLDVGFKNGYLDEAQYESLKSMITFGYKDEYNQVMNSLKTDLTPEIYKYVSTSPEAVKYIQERIDEVGGKITGKDGQSLITDLRTKFSNELSDNISVKSLSKAMSGLTNSAYYKNGVLTQLGDYSVGEVMNNYYSGEYNYLGIDYLVEQIKPSILTMKSGSTSGTDVNKLLETIWKLNGYSGTYKDSNSSYQREICETALLIATCNVANDRNLSEFIDGALGSETENIYYYDTTTKRYSPAVMNSSGLGVVMESTGSGENMFRMIWVQPSVANKVLEDGYISSSSGYYLNMSNKAYSSEVNYVENQGKTIDIGQESFDLSKSKTKIITMKDNEEMMKIVDSFNSKYAVPYRKNAYLADKYGM